MSALRSSAIDATRRAVNSARRGFSQLRADFSSINPGRMTGSINTGFRAIRQQVLRTAGITRTWLSVTMRGTDVVGTRTLPKMRRAIKDTGKQMSATSKDFVQGGKQINSALSSNLLTLGLYSTSVVSLARNMTRATLEMDQYVRGFKALEGGQREALTTMQEDYHACETTRCQHSGCGALVYELAIGWCLRSVLAADYP